MPSILKGRAKSCLVLAVFNAAICLSSVSAQEKPSADWFDIWENNNFVRNEDETLVQNFIDEKKIVSNNERLTDYFFDLADILKLGASINFGYEYNQHQAGRSDPVLTLGDSSVNWKLNLSGYNRIGDTSINLLQIAGNTFFEQDVSLSLGTKTESASMLNIVTGSATFNGSLNVYQVSNSLNTPGGNILVEIGAGSSLVLNGSTELKGLTGSLVKTSNTAGTGIYFGNENSKLTINDSLTINAADVFRGKGKITVNLQGEKKVALNGSLDGFEGTYTQTGGYFATTGYFNKGDDGFVSGWKFNDVNITTNSSNLLRISADEWTSESLGQQSIFNNGSTFGSIELTDEKVSLDYLVKAQQIYKDSTIISLGEVTVTNGVLSEITFDNHFGVLDKPNLILSHVTLNLKEQSVLQGTDLKIGALKLETEGDLYLKNSDVVLYSGKGDISTNISSIVVDQNSSLLIHGQINYSSARNYYEPTHVNSNVLVKFGSKFTLSGQVAVEPEALIENHGAMNVASGAVVRFLGDVRQSSDGQLEFAQGSRSQFHQTLDNQGKVVAGGTLMASEVKNTGEFQVTGVMAASNVSVGDTNEGYLSSSLQVMNGGIVKAENLVMNNGSLTLSSSEPEMMSWAFLDNLEMRNSSMKIQNNSVVLYGIPETQLEFQKGNLETLTRKYQLEGFAVLALNSSMSLDSSSRITLGKETVRTTGANLTLGHGSALIFNPQNKQPVFTSKDPTTLALEEGSKLIVLDPFNLGYLTDSNVDVTDGFVGSEIVSANPNVIIGLNKKDDGWMFERVEVIEKNFLYPQIQNVLYNSFEDFNINSANVGVQFFARVDNGQYMSSGISHRLLAEGTQLSALTGAQMTAFLNAKRTADELTKETAFAKLDVGELKLYAGIIGSAAYSKHINSYLGSDKFRAFSEGVNAGAVYGLSDSVKLSFGISAVQSTSKTSGAVMEAKNKQWNYSINAALRKEAGDFYFGTQLGWNYANNNISGSMPSSMMMDDMKLKGNFNVMSVGASAGYQITEWADVSFKPTLWHYSKFTDKTKIGGKHAFNLKNSAQTFVELPLALNVNQKIMSVKGVDLSMNAGMEGAVRVGQVRHKGSLSIVGLNASENLNLGRFNRWTTNLNLGVKGAGKNFASEAYVGAQNGDTRISVTGGIRASWQF